jgi:hypothetical protein
MKYGEDKLFFFQLFGKVDDITMSTIPMYHVNRYDENSMTRLRLNTFPGGPTALKILLISCGFKCDASL